MPRRKARRTCPIEGCENIIIYDRLMCEPCLATLPSDVRRKNMKVWRELRPFVTRWSNQLRYDEQDHDYVMGLVAKHHANCDDTLDRANRIRKAKAIPPDNPIAKELEALGL